MIIATITTAFLFVARNLDLILVFTLCLEKSAYLSIPVINNLLIGLFQLLLVYHYFIFKLNEEANYII
jgi:hypothetical protein